MEILHNVAVLATELLSPANIVALWGEQTLGDPKAE